MKIDILKADELRSWTPTQVNEGVAGAKKKLAEIRMDLYTPANTQTGNIRKLKLNIARLMTVKHSQIKPQATKGAKKSTKSTSKKEA